MQAADLIAFEAEVAERFGTGAIRGPVHLSGGNEAQLIEIFKGVRREDWVLSTWRSHYHALLHGVPRERVMAEIMDGRSMNLNFPEHRFLTSAICGGIVPIAVGIAAGMKRAAEKRSVWCFVGDMASTMGVFHEALQYARGHGLPIQFVIEDNGLSTNTPTKECWQGDFIPSGDYITKYTYERTVPHVGIGRHIRF